MSEARIAWAEQTTGELSRTLTALSLPHEVIDLGSQGTALAIKIDDNSFVTILVPIAVEGPSTVVVSTGVLRDIDASRHGDALIAVNAANRTRMDGRCVVTWSSDGQLLFTLHQTIVPAILTTVPQFFQALLNSFSPLSARKLLRSFGIQGDRWVWRSTADLIPVLDAVDDQADVLLDLDELMMESGI
ncbi:MAG TPA: hypothetical protein VGP46_03270 [Acidimicrobiales bacterium]|nr:hypothetical protein [Acidimicrobiales bacterium]